MTDWKIRAQWTGKAFRPIDSYWARVCDKELVVGENYWIEETQARSRKSHDHYFATIHEGWKQLPERFAQMFDGSDGAEKLRKYCLIKMGYHQVAHVVFSTPADAITAAAHIADWSRADNFKICTVEDAVVSIYTAETQRKKAMGHTRFQKSKQDVLEMIAELIGVSVETLASNTRKAA